MIRRLEMTDIFVTIGFIATMYGGYLLYLASYGGGVATARLSPPSAIQVPVRAALQTAMGKAIVERATLDHHFTHAILEGAQKLGQATFAMERRRAAMGSKTLEARAAQFRADYTGAIQYVLGSMIVNFTRHGVRQGWLTADNLDRSPFNARMLATTASLKNRAESQFNRTWQERLGQWIVDDATKGHQFTQRMQERIGQATVGLARTQHLYRTSRAKIDTQFDALVAAADRVARQIDTVVPMAATNSGMLPTLGHSFSARDAQPLMEIPFAVFVLAFGGLAAIFFIGLTMLKKQQDPSDIATRIMDVTKEIYRRTG